MNSAVITAIRGLLQINKIAEHRWSVTPVVYGSNVVFQEKELKVEEIDRLVDDCKLPPLSFLQDSYIVEYFDGMSVEELSRFGFARV